MLPVGTLRSYSSLGHTVNELFEGREQSLKMTEIQLPIVVFYIAKL